MININFIGAPRRVFGFGLAVMVALLVVLLAPIPAHAITLTVNSTADPGTGGCDSTECTLREAINASNGLPTTETIEFDIPDNPAIAGPEVKTISPSSQLPSITDNVTINGYTQAGSVVNSASTNASSAVLKIQLSGLRPNGSRLTASGLTIETSSCLIKGLAINRFGQHGVLIRESSTDTATGNKLEGNFIGTDPGGTIDRGNAQDGVRIGNSSNTTIGGTSAGARNVISGNNANGVFVSGTSSATFNKIEGNFIGTDANGTSDLGNAEVGVRVETPGNVVGGTVAGSRNVISGNGGTGVSILATGVSTATNNKVQGNFIGTNASGTGFLSNFHGVFISGAPGNLIGGTVAEAANTIAGNLNNGVMVIGDGATGNSILRNSIFGNGNPGGLGIALNNDGVTANDPKDPDTGPNRLQNFPVITSASTTTIAGRLNSRPNKTFTIQFFSNPAPNFPTGFGEGETFLGEKTVTTNSEGRISFTFATALTAGEVVTATATRLVPDPNAPTALLLTDTSEFSAGRFVE